MPEFIAGLISQSSTSHTSEFVMSAGKSVLPKRLSTVSLERGIQKLLIVKNCEEVVSAGIQYANGKMSMASTPQDIILEEKTSNC